MFVDKTFEKQMGIPYKIKTQTSKGRILLLQHPEMKDLFKHK